MSEHSLNIVFAGTPELAATALQALQAQDNFNLTAVLTQPDRPAGRGRKLAPSAVKTLAQQYDLPIFQPEDKSALFDIPAIANADAFVVAAFGMILPESILQRPRYGSLNIHTSLLPRWRGAAPIQRAIEAGDAETGVSIMQMDAGLDTGDVLLQKICTIEATDTAGSLHDKLAKLGAKAIVEVLLQLETGALTAQVQQDTLASYAQKLHKSEGEIDWLLPAEVLERKIRAFNPSPVCFTELHGHRLRIWQAKHIAENHQTTPGQIIKADKQGIQVACGQHSLLLEMIQPAGKKVMPAIHFLNGQKDFPTESS